MKKLSRFEKFGMVAAVIVACTFYYMKRIYEPQEAKLNKTVTTLNKVVKEYNDLSDTPPAAAVRRVIEAYEKDLEELNIQFQGTLMQSGNAREATQLLSEINNLMAANHLQVNSLVPAGVIVDELMEWKLYQIDLDGSFTGFLGFLEDLKTLKDAVKVEQVHMEKKDARLAITLDLMI